MTSMWRVGLSTRAILWAVGLLLSFGAVGGVSLFAQCISSTTGLVGWWPGDGNANNVLGTNNATLQGGANASAAGRVGLAFNFDGTNNFVQIPDSPILRPANLTIETWVRFNGLDTPGSAEAGRQYLVFKQNTANTDFEGYDLSKTRVGGNDVFEFRISAPGQSVAATATTLIATGVWYHVAAVRSTNFLQIYVNGQLQRQTNVAFAQSYGTLPLYFGSSGQAFWDRKFRGTLDEVTLYNRALSSNEIAAIYNIGVGGKCKEVAITTSPQSQNAQVGGNANFSVAATGFGTLRYRWMFNGATISGATNATFGLTNVQPASAGNYAVAVSNTLNVITSASAVLTVSTPPVINSAPQSQTVTVGGSANFVVNAGGTAPLSFQWRKGNIPLNGQTAAALSFSNATTNDAGNYDVVVTNLVGAVTSTPPATLTVNVPAFVTLGPQSQTTVIGSNVSFSVVAGGTAPLGYQWRKGGVALLGRTSAILLLSNVTTADAASYDVVVTNVAGAVTSSPPATLTVNVPPFISGSPASQTVVQGTNVSWTVVAGGTAPLSYQWRKGGLPLLGQTTASLALLSVTVDDAGNYDVVVTNIVGAVTSTPPATLTVNVPPFVNVPPQSQSAVLGTNVTFSVDAGGTQPLGYVWQKNGSPLNNQTNSSLVLVGVTTNDAGGYAVTITNVAGAVTSSPPASLVVNVPPSITAPPQNQTVIAGSNVNFSVIAGGTAPLSFQWRKGGANLFGQTGTTLILSSVSLSDAGNYDVVVANVAGAITSSPPAVLTVNVPPFITNAPQSQSVTEGNFVSLNVGAGGTSPLSFQWRKGGAALNGQTGTTLSFPSVTLADAGSYDVVVVNIAGSVTSSPPATLTVTSSTSGVPIITNPPPSQTVVLGTDVSFAVGAYGTAPLRYQWRKQGVNLANRTNATLVLSAVVASDAGNYDVVVTNSLGAVTSFPPALLTIIPPIVFMPSITNQPQSQRVGVGASVSLSVGAGGTGPLSYQWRKNNSPIGGQTGSTLVLSDVTTNNDGNYDVMVTNVAGSVTSLVASLSVKLVVDPELEKAILCASTNQLGVLTTTDIQSVVRLTVRNRGITNLFGLQFATNLATLDASENQISDLAPLQGLAKLSSLELDNNRGDVVSLLPIAGLTNLSCLVLGQVYLNSYASLSGLSNLTSLVVRKGNVTGLNFLQNLRKLSSLSLPQNRIRNLSPLSGLTNLSRLDLRWNPSITNYSALQAGLSNLTSLHLGGNAVTNPPSLQNLGRLRLLDLSENEISSLPSFTGLTNLSYLVLNRNPLTNYSTLTSVSNLNHLELSGNAISNVAFLSGLKGLLHVDLSYNAIADLAPLVGLTNLQGLALAGNRINSFVPLTSITGLSNLWLQGCSITNASFISGLHRLRHLNLDDNSVSDVTPVLGLTNLTGLGLSRIPAANVLSVSALTSLTGLRLEGNSLTEASALTNLHRLAYLSLCRNRLTNAMPFTALTNLQNQYLSQNRLRDISYAQFLPRSTVLDFGLNLLKPTNGTPELTIIEGLHCQLATIPQCACALPIDVPPAVGVNVSFLRQHSVPSISAPARWFIPRNSPSTTAFTVWYELDPLDSLPVTASSSNLGLIDNAGLTVSAAKSIRNLTVSPKADQTGDTSITLTVFNDGGISTSTNIQVSVVMPVYVEDMMQAGIPLDPELESAFRQASGNYDSDLTSVDLLNITQMIAPNVNFSGFLGWQWLTNLTAFYLNGASGDLSFLTNLTQLKVLQASDLAATELVKLSILTNLTEVELSGSSISNLSFLTTWNALKLLAVNRTRVSDLSPLAGLTNLNQVRVQRNMLTNILALYGLPQLSYADVRNNLLATSAGSLPLAVISGLQSRGVSVDYQPQRAAPTIDVASAWNISGNRTSTLTFSIFEGGDLAFDLIGVGSHSSNAGLLPDSNLDISLDPNSTAIEWALTASPVLGQSGGTIITISATNDVGLNSSTNLLVSVSQPLPLDGNFFGTTNVTWQTGGNVGWFGQNTISIAGFPAAQSGAITHGQSSALEATLIGPGTLSYWWKVSSEADYDWLTFESQGFTNQISGVVDWQEQVVSIAPRTQTVRWRYSKDLNAAGGMDAGWVAHVTFTPAIWLDLLGPPTNAHSQIALYGLPGQQYAMEISTNAMNWQQLGTVLSTNRITPFVDTAATNSVRFYRARTISGSPLLGLTNQTDGDFGVSLSGDATPAQLLEGEAVRE